MKTKLIGLILARNEEDIIGECISHHIKQGINQFIVTDNASTDKTREIAASFKEVVEIIDEPKNTCNQDQWATRMARAACKYSPDWLVVIDADEFWFGLETLDEVSPNVGVLCVEDFYLHPPTNKIEEPFHTSQMPVFSKEHRDFGENLTGRLLFRPSPNIFIEFGNHYVHNVAGLKQSTNQIYVHHYPNRLYERFEKKIVAGTQSMIAGGHSSGYAYHWRAWYQAWEKGELQKYYNDMLVII